MLNEISTEEAFELLTDENLETNDLVYFKRDSDSYVKATSVVWNFGKNVLSNRGIHFNSTKFFIEK